MSISLYLWLLVMLNQTGTGIMETQIGLIVKQELLITPPFTQTRYKTLPGLDDRSSRQPAYRIYDFKPPQ